MKFDGFDWDSGNTEKIRKHGLTTELVEWLFYQNIWVTPDIRHSDSEERFIAIGQSDDGRYIFIGFTIRIIKERRLVRPFTGRYMHSKEIEIYEQKRK